MGCGREGGSARVPSLPSSTNTSKVGKERPTHQCGRSSPEHTALDPQRWRKVAGVQGNIGGHINKLVMGCTGGSLTHTENFSSA